MSKLNILLAEKVMQWTMDAPPGIPAGYRPAILFDRNDGRGWQTLDEMGWNPEKHLDDALVCLERTAQTRDYELCRCAGYDKRGDYEVFIKSRHYPDTDPIALSYAPTAALAMCLCSLRSMGVPESEISIAMEE